MSQLHPSNDPTRPEDRSPAERAGSIPAEAGIEREARSEGGSPAPNPPAAEPRGDVAALPPVAALPLRHAEDGSLRVALMTSRETRRWVIPKGWPMRGLKNHKAAAKEAKEEAGLVGRVDKAPLGVFHYWKRRPGRVDLCRVDVFRMSVDRQLKTFREKGERQLRWFPLPEAAALVDEPELRDLILAEAAR